jgi:hypothetical protein
MHLKDVYSEMCIVFAVKLHYLSLAYYICGITHVALNM